METLSQQQGLYTVTRGRRLHEVMGNERSKGLQERSEDGQGQTLTSLGRARAAQGHRRHLQLDTSCLEQRATK